MLLIVEKIKGNELKENARWACKLELTSATIRQNAIFLISKLCD